MSVTETRTVGSIIGGSTRTAGSGSSRATPRTSTRSSARPFSATRRRSRTPAARRARRSGLALRARRRCAARRSSRSGGWSEENKEALARLVTREIGKPYPESLGEVQEVVDTCDFFLGEGRRLYGRRCRPRCPTSSSSRSATPWAWRRSSPPATSPSPSRGTSCRRSCAATPSSGSRRSTPRARRRARPAVHPRGLPDGVLNLVQCNGPAAFEGLERALEEGLVDKVGFTGVRRRLAHRRALRAPRAVALPRAGRQEPARRDAGRPAGPRRRGSALQRLRTAGQRCTSLGTVIVHESVHDDFMQRFSSLVEGAAVGDPTEDVLYGPMIHERFAERFEDWLGLIRDHHAVSARPAAAGSAPTTRATASSEIPTPASTATPRSSTGCGPTTTSTRPRRSARSSAWRPSPTSTRRSPWRTATATGSRRPSTRPTRSGPSASASG